VGRRFYDETYGPRAAEEMGFEASVVAVLEDKNDYDDHDREEDDGTRLRPKMEKVFDFLADKFPKWRFTVICGKYREMLSCPFSTIFNSV
jgi:hypothetical protein